MTQRNQRRTKNVYRSKTIIAMIFAILYAFNEQFVMAINENNEFNISDVNWGMLSTAVLAIVLRFFNDQKLTL